MTSSDGTSCNATHLCFARRVSGGRTPRGNQTRVLGRRNPGHVGASFAHNRIAANLTIEIGVQLKGKSCSVVGSDQRVQVLSESTFVYPDLTVVCGPPQFEDHTKPDTLLNPTLLVEVLSASTKSPDRGDKFFLYRQLPTLQQYLLLDSQRVHAELHTRDAQSRWILTCTPSCSSTALAAKYRWPMCTQAWN